MRKVAILKKEIVRAKAIIRSRSRINTVELLWAIHIAEQELGKDCTIDEINEWSKGKLKGRSDDDTSD